MAAGSWQLIWAAGNAGSGTITLASLPQTGATTGQAIVWNGSSWAPATVSSSGGSGTVTALVGDVTSSSVDSSGNATTTVAYVNGKSASLIGATVSTVGAATSSASPSTLMLRDSNGQFNGTYIGSITPSQLTQAGATTGQVLAWNGSNFAPATVASGTSGITQLTGDVTTPASSSGSTAATVAQVGGKTASAIASAVSTVAAATAANTASTLLMRDSNGQVAATTFTGALSGNATSATTAASATSYTGAVTLSQLSPGSASNGQVIAYNGTNWVAYTLPTYTPGITQLNGDVTTPASSSGNTTATVAQVGGKTASAIASAVTTVAAATNANTASTLVMRDSNGNFSGGTFTGSVSGNATTATTATTATNYSGTVALSQLAQSSATSGQVISWNGSAWAAATVASGTSGITQLTGDVTTASGSSGSTASTVAYVGGTSAANVASAVSTVSSATASAGASTLPIRDTGYAFGRGTGLLTVTSSVSISAANSGYTYYVPSGSPTLTLPANPSGVSLKYYFVTNGSTVTLAQPSGGTFYYFSGSTTSSINTVNSFIAASIELTGLPGSSNYILTNEHGNWNSAGNPLNTYAALSYPATSGYVLTANGSSGGAVFAAPPSGGGGSSAPVFAASIASPPASATGTIYVATSTVTSTLPSAPATATQFTFLNGSGGTQTIAQNSGTQIWIGNTSTTSGASGSLVLNGQGSAVTIACQAGASTWYKLSAAGQVTTN